MGTRCELFAYEAVRDTNVIDAVELRPETVRSQKLSWADESFGSLQHSAHSIAPVCSVKRESCGKSWHVHSNLLLGTMVTGHRTARLRLQERSRSRRSVRS